MLSVFIGILTVVIVVVSLLLILIVLMQRPKQEGLGAAFGGGMMDSVAGAHTSDVLQKGTTWLATIFLCTAVLLAVLKAKEIEAIDPGELLPAAQEEPALPPIPPTISDLPTPEAPATPTAPATPAPAEESAPAEDSPAPEAKAEETPAPTEAEAETPAPAAPAPTKPANEEAAKVEQ